VTRRHRMFTVALALALCVKALHGQASAGSPTGEELRAKAIRLPDIMDALAVSSGSHVADIGAGEGFFTVRLAKKVGPDGHVFAIDIDDKHAIPKLKELVKKESLENVSVILSEPGDPKLPTEGLDAALMVIVYHEVEPYKQMLAHVFGALKPGGRFVIVDNMPHKTRSRPRADQMKNHVLSPELTEAELKAAGFEITSRQDYFVDRPNEEDAKWMIVSRRPK
jgi:predicted methyltransferase